MYSLISFICLLLGLVFLTLGILSVIKKPQKEAQIAVDNRLYDRVNVTSADRESDEHARILGRSRGERVDNVIRRHNVLLDEKDGKDTDNLPQSSESTQSPKKKFAPAFSSEETPSFMDFSEEETNKLHETENKVSDSESETDRLSENVFNQVSGPEDETNRLIENKPFNSEDETDRLSETENNKTFNSEDETDRLSGNVNSLKKSFDSEDETDRLSSYNVDKTFDSEDETDRLSSFKTDKSFNSEDETDRLSSFGQATNMHFNSEDETDRLSSLNKDLDTSFSSEDETNRLVSVKPDNSLIFEEKIDRNETESSNLFEPKEEPAKLFELEPKNTEIEDIFTPVDENKLPARESN